MVKLSLTPATPADIDTLTRQLDRSVRGLVAVAARCQAGKPGSGHPSVVATAARLENGEPFPTCFYLTCPAAVRACSVLEATQVMAQLNQDLAQDPQLAADYGHSHQTYLEQRQQVSALVGVDVPVQIAAISAGGMPTRVKCLHALLGHALASGPGVNPIGDWVLGQLQQRQLWEPTNCSWGR